MISPYSLNLGQRTFGHLYESSDFIFAHTVVFISPKLDEIFNPFEFESNHH